LGESRTVAAGVAIRALLEPHPTLAVPIPAYGGRSLPNVSSSAVQAAGAEVSGQPPLLPPLASDLDPFEGRRAEGPVVVLLVDGMGFGPPAGLGAPGETVPSGWLPRVQPITSVFPTTTTVALTSLSTAEPPARHGVVGHRMFLPTYGTVAELLRMSPLGVSQGDVLAGPEWKPSLISGVPSLFRRGVDACAVSRDRFEPTAFTRLLYDGAAYVGYSTAADFAHRLGELLGRADPPSLIFAYWDELDAIQHLRGPRPEFAAFEAAQTERILAAAGRRLDPVRARRTTVLITSDHGQVPADPAREIAVEREPTIAPHLLHPPTGDRRAGFFAARPGHAEALREALDERLPAGARVLAMSAAVDAGLFGPPPFHPELAARLGDWLALVPSPAGLVYNLPGAAPRTKHLIGAHGGLESAELVVPLVAGPLVDLAGISPAD
jgi:hypothetical protein